MPVRMADGQIVDTGLRKGGCGVVHTPFHCDATMMLNAAFVVSPVSAGHLSLDVCGYSGYTGIVKIRDTAATAQYVRMFHEHT